MEEKSWWLDNVGCNPTPSSRKRLNHFSGQKPPNIDCPQQLASPPPFFPPPPLMDRLQNVLYSTELPCQYHYSCAATPCFIMFHLQFADCYTAKTVGYIQSTVRNHYANYDSIYLGTFYSVCSAPKIIGCYVYFPALTVCIILTHTKYFFLFL